MHVDLSAKTTEMANLFAGDFRAAMAAAPAAKRAKLRGYSVAMCVSAEERAVAAEAADEAADYHRALAHDLRLVIALIDSQEEGAA